MKNILCIILIIVGVFLSGCNEKINVQKGDGILISSTMNKRKIIMSREESFAPSQDTYIDSIGPGKSYGVVFEINKETAYFYALSLKNNGDIQEMLDALHIFNISDVVDREVTSKLNIDWSEDGSVALLFINDSPHAMFDFTNKQGYNRTELPKGPSQSGWSKGNKKLQDSMLTDLFIFE